VGVFLSRGPGRARLAIQDDGRGFDLASERSAHEAGHLGLYGIRERVALMGGQTIIASTPGQGTTLTVEIPLQT
jgi:signal transduction histidine kinase